MDARTIGRRRLAGMLSGAILAVTSALLTAAPVTADETTVGSYPSEFTAVAGRVFFSAGGVAVGPDRGLWMTDGTHASTRLVRTFQHGPSDLTAMDGKAWFLASPTSAGRGLWMSDGTAPGTRSIRSFRVEDEGRPILLTRVRDRLFFLVDACMSDAGYQLWTSDGTPTGTVRLRTFRCRDRYGDVDSPGELVAVGGQVFFGVDTKGIGYELWASDGTHEGTRLVRDLWAGPEAGYAWPIAAHRGLLYFWGSDRVHGTALWRSDGTTAGTRLVKDIDGPSAVALRAAVVKPAGTAHLGRRLFFGASDGTSSGLWATDGTRSGTTRIKAFSGGFLGPIKVADRLFMVGGDAATGQELWVSDGTTAGTHRVRDIRQGPRSSRIDALTAFGRMAFFVADDGIHGREPWVSDGTAAGTHLLRDIARGPDAGWGCLTDQSVGVAIGLVFLAANDGVRGCEPWRSDGTRAGTRRLGDLARP
jgi:ELWxxDGT repeat protein